MRFGILGPLRVGVGSDEVVIARRERVLLSVLLLHANRTVSVERVVDAIWGERPPADSTGQVHSTVYRLRKALVTAGASREIIVTDPAGYRIQVDPESLDHAQFRRLRDQARAAAGSGNLDQSRELHRAALDLWRGLAFDGVDSDHIRHAAAGLDEEHLQVAEECIEVELSLGRGREVVAELTGLVGQHPHREGLHRALMLALYRAGRQADALAAYRSARASLQEELGLEPGPQLQRLHQAILNRDPELDAPAASAPVEPADPGRSLVPRELPADVAGFTGRDDALKALDGLLADPPDGSAPVVISAIAGTAGIGKTALAVHWGHRVADRFPDGQLYLNLRGYAAEAAVRPTEALYALLRSLGVKTEEIPADEAQAAGRYRSELAGRRVLVVLDNAGSVEQVRPLLPGSAGCLALVTSRDRLGGLVARDGARRLTLDVLTSDEAQELLTRLLGSKRVAEQPQATTELARECAYLPLALRVAAAALLDSPELSIDEYATDLRSGDRLTMLQVDGDEDSALKATFDLSYRRLPAEARRLFRLLGLVPGADCTVPAAAALGDITDDQAGNALARLASAHLVEQHVPDRYTFHDLLRLYARERAETDEETSQRDRARRQLLDYYLLTADAAAALVYPQVLKLPMPSVESPTSGEEFDGRSGALAWLDVERPNLVAAVQEAAEGGPRPLAWLLADRLRRYFWQRGHTVDWLTTASAALAASKREGDHCGQAAAQLSLATFHLSANAYAEAVESYMATAESARRAGWTDCHAVAVGGLGSAYQGLGQLLTATKFYEQALVLNRSHGRLAGQAANEIQLGLVCQDLGQLDSATAHTAEALALFRRLGDVIGEANALNTLGGIDHDLGRLDVARASLMRALAMRRGLGDVPFEGGVLDGLAAVNRDLGNLEGAVELAHASVALLTPSGNHRHGVLALNTLGSVYLRLRIPQQALDCYRHALELASQAGARPEIEARIGIAEVECALDRPDRAHEYAHQALTLATEAGFRVLEGQVLTVLADLYLGQGEDAVARDYASRALDNHRQTGHRLGEARTLTTLGTAFRSNSDPLARRCWRAARQLYVEMGAAMPEELDANHRQ